MEAQSLKDQACAQVYVGRMMKLQSKLREMRLFPSDANAGGGIGRNGSCCLFEAPFLPQQFIDVGWGDKDTENVALFGNVLPLARSWEKPNVVFEAADGVFYTILAVDADHQSGAPYLLWARLNVSGDARFSSGRDIVRWQPPHPTEDGSHHRIFIVVFHQSGGAIDLSQESKPIVSKNSREGRCAFSLAAFVQAHRLGHVIGANGWRVGYDAEVVPRIIAELRDRVVLDATGRRVLREELDGVCVYECTPQLPPPSAPTHEQV